MSDKMNSPREAQLVRGLGLLDATMIVIGAINRCSGLVVAGVADRWIADDHRGTLLRGAGDDDAACRRRLCFLARNIRTSAWIFIWLDPFSRRANRNDRCGGDRICEISRRLRAKCCRRSLSDSADRPL